jgi:hypothetical protein
MSGFTAVNAAAQDPMSGQLWLIGTVSPNSAIAIDRE